MDYFQMQEIFIKKMLEDHKNGMLNNGMLEPYFAWKSGKAPTPSLQEAMDIVNVAVGMLDDMRGMELINIWFLIWKPLMLR